MSSLRVVSVAVLVALSAIAAGLAGTGSEGAPAEGNTSAVSATTRGSRMDGGGTASSGVDVRRENALPGTRDWRISAAAGTASGLAAWSGTLSVRPGQPIPLHVSGSGTVQVRALRIGWYGGTGARQVWRGTLTATPGAADPASWPVSARPGTTDWPPGHYLLRLDLGAASRYIPLTVRSAGAGGDVLLVTSPLTWQADNGNGGTRSLDRPYAQEYGAGGFLTADAPIVQLAERDGTRLAYATDADLAAQPTLMDGAAALAVGSTSQYWTAPLRTAVISAIGSGTNAAFFGAGTGTRRVEQTGGARSLALQQTVPTATTALTGLTPICPVSSGTAPVSSGTAPLPNLATGARSWVVQDATWWGYRGASVSPGQRLPGLVSTAADGGLPTHGTAASGTAASGTAASGRAVQVLAQSPGACSSDGPTGRAGDSATSRATGPQQAVYWTNPAGAAVFSTGTSRWACVALGTCPGAPVDRASRAFAVQVTRTVLTAFAQPQAGRTHPAIP